MKGLNGVDCGTTCTRIGLACNSQIQSTLTSNALVARAFLKAGYTCNGFHGSRGYAGSPFSTGRSDDCAPITSGTQSTCTENPNANHSALCYCEGAHNSNQRTAHTTVTIGCSLLNGGTHTDDCRPCRLLLYVMPTFAEVMHLKPALITTCVSRDMRLAASCSFYSLQLAAPTMLCLLSTPQLAASLLLCTF